MQTQCSHVHHERLPPSRRLQPTRRRLPMRKRRRRSSRRRLCQFWICRRQVGVLSLVLSSLPPQSCPPLLGHHHPGTSSCSTRHLRNQLQRFWRRSKRRRTNPQRRGEGERSGKGWHLSRGSTGRNPEGRPGWPNKPRGPRQPGGLQQSARQPWQQLSGAPQPRRLQPGRNARTPSVPSVPRAGPAGGLLQRIYFDCPRQRLLPQRLRGHRQRYLI